MLAGYAWMVVLGCLFCCFEAVVLGATSMCVIWGPLIGARVLTYSKALSLQIICLLVGNILFGPYRLLPYSGIIKSTTRATFTPELVMYALLCVAAALALWVMLAYWQKIPVSPFAALATSLAGTAVVFPGASSVDWGSRLLPIPPYISGLGPVYLAWFIMPMVSTFCVAALMLALRPRMRAEDSFYQVLWRLPSIACLTTATYVAYILYVLAAPNGLKINTLSAQAILILLCTCGAGACILTTLFIPVVVSKFGSMAPREAQIKRMNLLGLLPCVSVRLTPVLVITLSFCLLAFAKQYNKSTDVVVDLAVGRISAHTSNSLRRFWDRTTKLDIFADVSRNEKLMQMHASAEQFDPAAERLFIPLQIVGAILLATAYAGTLFRSAIGVFGAILSIYDHARVLYPYPVATWLRCLSGVLLIAGSIVGGQRLMPVTGVQLAKMTPFRSYIVVVGSCATSVFAKAFGYDTFTTYISVSAIMAVGLTEGVTHVNWRRAATIIAWWYLGCLPVFSITALFNWQGTRAPSAGNLAQVRADYAQIQASVTLLTEAFSSVQPSTPVSAVSTGSSNLDLLKALKTGVQTLVIAYDAAPTTCSNSSAQMQ